MRKRQSKRSYRTPDNRFAPIYLVVCEGETEKDYLEALAMDRKVHAQIIMGEGTDPKSIVKTAKKKAEGFDYDKVFCVFDRDHNLNGYLQAINQCHANKFIPVPSNPCFEVWLFLTQKMRDTAFGNPENVIKELKKLPGFSKYEKDGITLFRMTASQIGKGHKHAAKLTNPKEDPYTGFHHVIDAILELEDKQKYFS